MLSLFLQLLLFAPVDSPQVEGMKRFESKETVLLYSIQSTKDKISLVGYLKEKKTNAPVDNINIEIVEDRIGTVPDLDGKFELTWQKKKDEKKKIIKFDKTGFEKFDFICKYP
jgi:lantibiotic modifying enzyme